MLSWVRRFVEHQASLTQTSFLLLSNSTLNQTTTYADQLTIETKRC
jgi:hypothetical protein